MESNAGYGVLLCSGDIPDFKLGLADNSPLSCFIGDLDARSVAGDEGLDQLPLGGV